MIRTLDPEQIGKDRGLNRVAWDLAYDPPRRRSDDDGEAPEFGGPPRGPEALPGTYAVRLTVDGRSYEKPVEVRVDPLVGASAEGLAAQFAAARRLTCMASAVNDSLRALDAVRHQRQALEATLETLGRELPAGLEESWKAAGETLDELLALLARAEDKPRWSQPPALGDLVDELRGSVDSAFAAPTPAQRDYQAELEGELAAALERLDRYLAGDLPRLNQALAAEGLPPLVVPEPAELTAGGG